MTSIATFCNVPVSAAFNDKATSSSVSLDWIMNSGVPTQNSRASGLLSLPCDAGVLSMFLNGISVAASLPSDLVLGLDWFQFVCNSTNPTSAVVVQLISGPLELRHNSLTSAGSPSVAPVFRGDIGVDLSSSSPVSQGGPGVVSTPSSMTNSNVNMNDDVNLMPMNNPLSNDCSVPLSDTFVRLIEHEKITVHIYARDSDGKLKSADTLRAEFLAHQCTEFCLILRSEAALAGLSPIPLSPSELERCKSNLRPNPRKRKSTSLDDNVNKRHRSSVETSETAFPIILSQGEKDQIVGKAQLSSSRQGAETSRLRRGREFSARLEEAQSSVIGVVYKLPRTNPRQLMEPTVQARQFMFKLVGPDLSAEIIPIRQTGTDSLTVTNYVQPSTQHQIEHHLPMPVHREKQMPSATQHKDEERGLLRQPVGGNGQHFGETGTVQRNGPLDLSETRAMTMGLLALQGAELARAEVSDSDGHLFRMQAMRAQNACGTRRCADVKFIYFYHAFRKGIETSGKYFQALQNRNIGVTRDGQRDEQLHAIWDICAAGMRLDWTVRYDAQRRRRLEGARPCAILQDVDADPNVPDTSAILATRLMLMHAELRPDPAIFSSRTPSFCSVWERSTVSRMGIGAYPSGLGPRVACASLALLTPSAFGIFSFSSGARWAPVERSAGIDGKGEHSVCPRVTRTCLPFGFDACGAPPVRRTGVIDWDCARARTTGVFRWSALCLSRESEQLTLWLAEPRYCFSTSSFDFFFLFSWDVPALCVPGRAGYTTTRRSSRFGFGFDISFFHLSNAFVAGLRAWLEPSLLAKFFRILDFKCSLRDLEPLSDSDMHPSPSRIGHLGILSTARVLVGWPDGWASES
ncbi:hypothetical protein B0H14DRAFT_3166650 [Mycena olivaceomarginata]|nr:hypothetical protein B0H14DRAFT_3166650 [Mycena olivaceomarginata]